MAQYTEEELQRLRDRKEGFLGRLGIHNSSIGLNRDGNVCIRLWCDRVTPELRKAIAEDDELREAPIDYEEGTDFVPFGG